MKNSEHPGDHSLPSLRKKSEIKLEGQTIQLRHDVNG